ncbi:hypothetical protein ABPG75_011672 [Micractinium tetrahymenae]
MRGLSVLVALLTLLSPTLACRPRIVGLRLEGGTSAREGRLAVQLDCGAGGLRRWYSTLCQLDAPCDTCEEPWPSPDKLAQVVCRQLGYVGGSSKLFNLTAQAQAARGPELATGITCKGSEASVTDCEFSSGLGSYPFGSCESYNSYLRLESRPDPNPIAAVICRQLGYPGAAALLSGAANASGPEPPMLLQLLRCPMGLTRLDDCDLSLLPPGAAEQGGRCSLRDPLAVRCTGADPPLRLTGGPSPREGRLEIQANGTWSAVCAASFPLAGAMLAARACRLLGFTGGAVRIGTAYGPAPASVLSADCSPGPTSLGVPPAMLRVCTFAPAPGGQCKPSSKGIALLGMACEGAAPVLPGVRLVNGSSPAEGRLEVLLAGRLSAPAWDRAISGPSDASELARAVCRELGLGGGLLHNSNPFGAGDLSKAIPQPACPRGAALSGCSIAAVRGPVDPPADVVSIACAGARTVQALRLVGGPSPSEGLVEALVGGSWGLISVPSVNALGAWDLEESVSGHANVVTAVCRQLGFPGGYARMGQFYLGDKGPSLLRGPVVLDSVSCGASARRLDDCTFSMLRGITGEPDEYGMGIWHGGNTGALGVACGNATNTITGLRLERTGPQGRGRLLVKLGGSWGTVSRHVFYDGEGPDEDVARVACAQLGYTHAAGGTALGD